MNIERSICSRLAVGLACAALWTGGLQAQTTVISATYVLPASAANTNQPGFIFNISEVNNSEPNQLAWAESQLAGLQGDNLADPTAAGVASGPAQPPNPSTAPISFIIPTVINLSRNTTSDKGNFIPDDQMPGLPGGRAERIRQRRRRNPHLLAAARRNQRHGRQQR
jgi:hypothetical protein